MWLKLTFVNYYQSGELINSYMYIGVGDSISDVNPGDFCKATKLLIVLHSGASRKKYICISDDNLIPY